MLTIYKRTSVSNQIIHIFSLRNTETTSLQVVHAGEFPKSIIVTLFEELIFKIPQELHLSELLQCLACTHITGHITKQNKIRVMVWPTDRGENISMQSLHWGNFFCNLEMESLKICKKYNHQQIVKR